MTLVAEVILWGRRIGAVALPENQRFASFEYDPEFVGSGIQVSPLQMPLRRGTFRFPELAYASFHGLPGLLADSLPDKFGNALIDAWLATQGRSPDSFNAIERLCYSGKRGMGALEFEPAIGPRARESERLEIAHLVQLASQILQERHNLKASFADAERADSLREILQVGTSAGGARAKAVIAWNPQTNEVRSGQLPRAEGFQDWMLKFDGVRGNRDRELDDPIGYGQVEYAYALMAQAAGIQMMPCRLLEENGRHHFMTQRFDRTPTGGKLHMQSLAALAHYDFNQALAHSYEQAFDAVIRLDLPMSNREELFRRMLFNVVARNQDDHVKNIAFLMDQSGVWSLAPAFDMTYAYNPDGLWTGQHQMSINGKRDGFTLQDIKACAQFAGLKRGRDQWLLEQVLEACRNWKQFAAEAGVQAAWVNSINQNFRLDFRP
ncbi:MAG: type II toxin-antitoxin system HipA family toxin [Acidobacteria bacterium]|nr:type II toxin-antitoxin system HipA family toxin [Acidobacteriota bacterium]